MFAPGEVVAVREIWRAEVWAARPMTVVRDDDELGAFWFPHGTRWLAPRALDGRRLRVPTEAWRVEEVTWELHDNLILVPAGAAHAVHLYFDRDGSHLGWYVNLQEPLRRTARGFDHMDLALDIVASPDLSRWEWKDEDDLATFASYGLLGADEVARVRAEGEAVVRLLEARAGLFASSWPSWRPEPDFPIPTLPKAGLAAL